MLWHPSFVLDAGAWSHLSLLWRPIRCFPDRISLFSSSAASLDADIRNERRLRSKETMQGVVGQQLREQE